MTFTELSKKIATCYNSLPALIDTLRAGFASVEGGGSSDHNYSTTEQKVGKWIDGKDLYEKTTNLGEIPANASTDLLVGIGVNVVETMVSYNITAVVPSGVCMNLPTPMPSNSLKYASYIDGYNKATDKITIITGESRTFSNAYVTLRYTKASNAN